MPDYHDRPRRSSWLALAISVAGMAAIVLWRLLECSGWLLTAIMVGCVTAGVNPVSWVLR